MAMHKHQSQQVTDHLQSEINFKTQKKRKRTPAQCVGQQIGENNKFFMWTCWSESNETANLLQNVRCV